MTVKAQTDEPTILLELTLTQAKHMASLALHSHHWDLLDLIERALRRTDLKPPMDVYCELVKLRTQLRQQRDMQVGVEQ